MNHLDPSAYMLASPVEPYRTRPSHVHRFPSPPHQDHSVSPKLGLSSPMARFTRSAGSSALGCSTRHWQIFFCPGKGSDPKDDAEHETVPGASPRNDQRVTSGCAANHSLVCSSGEPVAPYRTAEEHSQSPPSSAHHFHESTLSSRLWTGIMHWQIFSGASGNGSTPPKVLTSQCNIPSTGSSTSTSVHFITSLCSSKYPASYISLVPVWPNRTRVEHGHFPPSFAHQSHFISGCSGLPRHSQRAPG